MPTIQEKEGEYKQYISTHRGNVKRAYERIVRKYAEKYLMPQSIEILDRNIEQHDEDKDIDFIFDAYRRNHFPVDDKEKRLADKDYEIAWNYHSKINPHHWQFFLDDDNKKFTTPKLETDEIKELYKLAYLEMLADWLSFGFKNAQDESGKGDGLSVTGDSLEFETWYNKNKNEIMIHPDMEEWFNRIVEDVITDIKENSTTIYAESFNRKERKHEDKDSFVLQTNNGFIQFLPNQSYKIVKDLSQASIGYNEEEMRMLLIGLLRKYKSLKAVKLTTLSDVKQKENDNRDALKINEVEEDEQEELRLNENKKEAIKEIYKGGDGNWVIDLKPGWYTSYGTTYIINKTKKACLDELENVEKEKDESMSKDGIEIDGIKGTISNSGMAN